MSILNTNIEETTIDTIYYLCVDKIRKELGLPTYMAVQAWLEFLDHPDRNVIIIGKDYNINLTNKIRKIWESFQ